MSKRPTPETDAVVRNAATADHPPTRLAATLTVKCEKLELERDEARKDLKITQEAWVKAKAERVEALRERNEARKETEYYKERYEQLKDERDEAREALEYITHSGLSARHIEDYAKEFLRRKEAAK
jgi:hypothetical protein